LSVVPRRGAATVRSREHGMNLFLKACGATGPLQLEVESQGAPEVERLTFDMPFVLIGRDPRNDLHLMHRDVSRRHAYLQLVAGQLQFVDLGSRIGTYAGDKFQRSGRVERPQPLRIGPYRIRLTAGAALEAAEDPADPADEGGAASPQPREAPRLPDLTLELAHRAIKSSLCPVDCELALVGSSADCQVRLLDPSVSNFHCSLVRTTKGTWVVDLLGQGGVLVNGTSVRYARVYDGDELHVGHSLIRLRYEAQRALHLRVKALPGSERSAPRPPALGARALPGRTDWSNWGGGPAPPPAVSASAPGPWPMLPEPEEPAATHLVVPGVGLSQFLQGQPPEKTELVESLLVPLVNQISRMQQQMFDQFNQSMMMMFQTFAALNQDQMRFLHEELDQIRRLTRELHALRTELAAQSPPARERGADAPARPARPAATPVRGDGAAAAPRPRASPAPSPSSSPAPNGARPASAEAAQDPPPRTVGAARHQADEAPPAEDIHAWLCHRITAIQTEQQTRWQKILSMMPGQSQGKPMV
jgi:pSer/pThr/pTyr-binding forkhead associated (FHA) protein